jgi:multimeric flavodoxin WrbA
MAKQVEILLICGSPRSHTSEALLGLLEQGAREAGARCRRFLLSQKHIDPCLGCGFCEKTGTCILADERAEQAPTDDYLELLEALAKADALAIVSPLFFAGPPAQLKALYDRLQPFWARRYILGERPPAKRPALLFILGGGGDNHGYDPLVTISKSALAVAGFSVEKVRNFIGFKRADDVTPVPGEEEAASMAFGELAHLRKAAALQREFEKNAIEAGSAFARFVRKALEKQELQAELRLIDAEMDELIAEEPVVGLPSEDVSADRTGNAADTVNAAASNPLAGSDYAGTNAPVSVNYVDEGFEALKTAARERQSNDT